MKFSLTISLVVMIFLVSLIPTVSGKSYGIDYLIDSFENGTDGNKITDNSDWIENTESMVYDNSQTPYGYENFSAYMNDQSGSLGSPLMHKTISTSNIKPEWISFYYRETSDSSGSAITFRNKSGGRVFGIMTDNPQFDVYDGNFQDVLCGGSGNYGQWYKVNVSFDWGNNTFSFERDDGCSGSGYNLSSGITSVYIENYAGEDFQASSFVAWYDEIRMDNLGLLITSPDDNVEIVNPGEFSYVPKLFDPEKAYLYTNTTEEIIHSWLIDSQKDWVEGSFNNVIVNQDYLKLSGIGGTENNLVESNGDEWITVLTKSNYDNPIVFATSNTINGGDEPHLGKVKNVGSASFEAKFCEPDDCGVDDCDSHSYEDVSYFMAELDYLNGLDGIEAGKLDMSNSGGQPGDTYTVNLDGSYSDPVVIAEQQTYNEAGSSGTQVFNVQSDSFQIYLCDHDGSDSCDSHGTETVAWMVINSSDVPLSWAEAGLTGGIGDSGATWVNYNLNDQVGVQTTINTNNGGQEAKPSNARDISNTQAAVGYCEHDGGGTCDNHADEQIGWFAYEIGLYSEGNAETGYYISKPFNAESRNITDGFDHQGVNDGDNIPDNSNWVSDNLDLVYDSSYKVEGGFSAYTGSTSAESPLMHKTIFNEDTTIQELSFYYRETSDSTGHGITLRNKDNERVIGLFTDNPEFTVLDVDGFHGGSYYGGDLCGSSNYDQWYKITVNFDWVNRSFSWERDDGCSGSGELGLYEGITSVYIEKFSGSSFGSSSVKSWVDEIRIYKEYEDPVADWNNSIVSSITSENTSIETSFLENSSGSWIEYNDIGNVPDSQYLKINVTLYGSESESPIVNSSELTYDTNQEVFKARKMNDSAIINDVENTISYTFNNTPGSWIWNVGIQVNKQIVTGLLDRLVHVKSTNVKDLHNVTYLADEIEWVWNNPTTDNYTISVYFEGEFLFNTTDDTYTATDLMRNTNYTLSLFAYIDGNPAGWTNHTARTSFYKSELDDPVNNTWAEFRVKNEAGINLDKCYVTVNRTNSPTYLDCQTDSAGYCRIEVPKDVSLEFKVYRPDYMTKSGIVNDSNTTTSITIYAEGGGESEPVYDFPDTSADPGDKVVLDPQKKSNWNNKIIGTGLKLGLVLIFFGLLMGFLGIAQTTVKRFLKGGLRWF